MLNKRYWVACLLAAMACSAGAQSSGPECSLGWSGGASYGALGPNKAAYTLTVRSRHEQQLYDGSYVRAFAITHQARSTDGRTMTQMAQQCTRGEDGQPHLAYSATVYDPKARTNLNWTVGMMWMQNEKVARLTHMPAPVPRKELTPAEREARRKAAALRAPVTNGYKTEDLGTRTIAGVEAKGTRRTMTTPIGEQGNEAPLVNTTETWTAKDLGIVLLGINDDPRTGKYIYEVEELTLGEPDPTLFTPPAGYVIKEVKPNEETVIANASPNPQ